jgi:phosphoglucosamine mutase
MGGKRKYFGTDGIRGIANQDPMTTDVALRVGRAAAYLFKREDGLHRVIIGKDTRRSSYMLEFAMAAGICSAGVDAFLVGPLPTPGIAFLTRDMRADAGVMISASHNPFQDNGIKFFDSDGFKLPDDVEMRIEEVMEGRVAEANPVTAGDVGRAWRIDDAIGRYIVFLKKSFPNNLKLEGVKVVLDCANGAAYKVAPEVFIELGASLTLLGNKPDGKNINDGCGALHPEALAKYVLEQSADIGIALDGDADRLVLVDEKGKVVDGDHVLAAIAKDMIGEGRLTKNTLVATIMSNMGLDVALQDSGGRVVRAGVGDRYVIEMMQRDRFNFGGEKSGHLIFLDEHTTGDGIMSALQVLAVLVKKQIPVSQFMNCMEDFPQVLRSVTVKTKKPFDEIPSVMKAMKSAEASLGGRGRVVLRYSGTELLARVMVEGPDQARIEGICDEITARILEEIGP